jgi:hypothetical protein
MEVILPNHTQSRPHSNGTNDTNPLLEILFLFRPEVKDQLAFWREMDQRIASLPDNVTVEKCIFITGGQVWKVRLLRAVVYGAIGPLVSSF